MAKNGANGHSLQKLVKRSRPDTSRPRMRDEFEDRFVEVDANSAACYAELEDLSDRFANLAADLRAESERNAAPIAEIDPEESLVYHVEEAISTARSRRADTESELALEDFPRAGTNQ